MSSGFINMAVQPLPGWSVTEEISPYLDIALQRLITIYLRNTSDDFNFKSWLATMAAERKDEPRNAGTTYSFRTLATFDSYRFNVSAFINSRSLSQSRLIAIQWALRNSVSQTLISPEKFEISFEDDQDINRDEKIISGELWHILLEVKNCHTFINGLHSLCDKDALSPTSKILQHVFDLKENSIIKRFHAGSVMFSSNWNVLSGAMFRCTLNEANECICLAKQVSKFKNVNMAKSMSYDVLKRDKSVCAVHALNESVKLRSDYLSTTWA